MAREDTPLDQPTFDRVLAEETAKGSDRRVAEGRARRAAVRAYRAEHGEEEPATAAAAASSGDGDGAAPAPAAAPAAAAAAVAAAPPAAGGGTATATLAPVRQAPAPTGNVPEPKKGAAEKHRLLALVPPEGIQRVE